MSAVTKSRWFAIASVTKASAPIFFSIGLSFLSFACSPVQDTNVRTPARELYNQAVIASEDQFYTEAEELFRRLSTEHSGTQLATLAYLQLGELFFKRTKWDDAEVNYRSFLIRNPNSHLTPYVISQIISLNYERNRYGVFIRKRSFDRDMEPNRKIIQEYQRFYLLYRQSSYLADVTELLRSARNDLAEYEYLVGEYYYSQKAYDSAITRYLYLLKTFPEFERRNQIAERLIDAYEKNQQPERANSIRMILEIQSSRST
jgi:outer membrane protein assembly factor BamD